jgi:hypothetical protein
MTETQLNALIAHQKAIDKALAFEHIVPYDYDNREELDPCPYCNCTPDKLYYDERASSRTCLSCAIDQLKEAE